MSLSFAMRGDSSPEVLSGAGGDSRRDTSAPQGVADLRAAIWSNQLTVHYQPQVELPGGSLVGVEALVRWHHPRFGVLAPADFLPVAERSGLMPALTTSVLATAAAQAACWWHEGHRLTMAVNIAPAAIGPTLVQDVGRVVETCGLPPGTLRLELTEDLRPEDVDRIRPTASRLRDLGVGLSADDFGAGCSSLAIVQALPIDEIKIDRSFVQQLRCNWRTLAIVRSMLDLCQRLGIQSVAEGIEDAETLNLLRDMGCDLAQGFLLGRPVPPDQISALLRGRPA
jgi:EAL domain-containing protein (putative c-di-GMP-specific phosphodiesterase class I)